MKMGKIAIPPRILVRVESVGLVMGLHRECACIRSSRDWLVGQCQAHSTAGLQGHICVRCGADVGDSGIQVHNTKGHKCAVSGTGV